MNERQEKGVAVGEQERGGKIQEYIFKTREWDEIITNHVHSYVF